MSIRLQLLIVALTTLVLPWVGGSWRLAFMVWAVPCVVIALALLAFAPRGRNGEATAPPRWWPDWKSGLIWRLGLMFGANNATYFTTRLLAGWLSWPSATKMSPLGAVTTSEGWLKWVASLP